MTTKFSLLDKDQIEALRPFWEMLNETHIQNSRYFKEYYRNNTFNKRIRDFKDIDSKDIRIELVSIDGVNVGYCISTKRGDLGEVDSIFINEGYRGQGLGRKLIENSLRWLREKNCVRIVLSVAEGNEKVFAFYQKFGFYPIRTYLQMKLP